MGKLEGLAEKLMYNSTLDVWVALCEDRGVEWFSVEAYLDFIAYLKSSGVRLFPPMVVDEVGRKGEFLEEARAKLGRLPEVYVVRTDSETLNLIKAYRTRGA